MRLEIATFSVKDVQFADQTRFEQGALYVDREELRQLVLDDGDFDDVTIKVVRPGDQVRIIHVMDAVEPRCKLEPGSTFPGLIGSQKPVGDGRTHRLAGMAVVSVGEPVAGEPIYWREALIEMAGPGLRATPFGSTLNLVLEFKPRPELLNGDQPEAVMHNMQIGSAFAQRYNRSVRVAEIKAAAYLARTTVGMEPASVQVYELAPVDPSLPGIVYFFQMDEIVYGLYGDKPGSILPVLLHPNEILDGALVNVLSNRHAAQRHATYLLQNHAVIQELYRRHGIEWRFLGVIAYSVGAFDDDPDLDKKEMIAEYAVKLARTLGAQGACSSFMGGGHPCVDFMLICQKCERDGIKTVLVMPESYGTPEDPGFVHFVPEATAIVSTGRTTQKIALPPMPTVIGGREFFDLPDSPAGNLDIPYRYLYASCTNIGYGQLAGRQY